MRIALTFNEKRGSGEDQAEFDTPDAIATIARLLAGLGHAVTPLDVTGSVPLLAARLERMAPDLVFNLAEGERGAFREGFYPALFEQLGLTYTGSSASTLALCLDKALAKRVVAAARVRVPRGRIAKSVDELGDLAPPLIVKPNLEGSSKGVRLVTDRAQLAPAFATVHGRYPRGVLVEEYVAGIDVAVGWFAGHGLLPPIWYRHDAPIYDYRLKHETPERVRIEVPELAPHVMRRLEVAATRAFTALGVTGYGRADFRVTPDGDVVFLELNPLPSLTLSTGHDELYVAAAHAGLAPRDLLGLIVSAAVRERAIERCA